ncbi:SoxR reducing system RseC family protein [Marinobacter sp. 71-i]|uniref:SoxR reducing system RseC family protein n=1 Tax=Marinobacter iranensis TaxID=2962607 RepID=A0ABT5YEG4_9GAMM|nr:SoxR reducing system RseC family protein [Marinobacter iranensis]MDF0751939.1 SoxR reducing system RseC family protein [Marinobacter iranensis]
MITETGKVVAINGDRVWVQTIRTSACESCSARQGCGQRALTGVSGGRANQVLVTNSLGAQVGDEVTVAIDESALLGASLLVYALPLSLLVAGSVLGHQLSAGHDGVAMLGAATGLALGFLVARRRQSDTAGIWEPKLVNIRPAQVKPAE